MDLILSELKSIKTEVGSLKTEVSGIKIEVSGLKTEVNSIKNEVGNLNTEVKGIKNEMGNLKTEVIGIKIEVGSLKTEVSSIKVEQKLQGNLLHQLIKNVGSTNTRLINMETTLHKTNEDVASIKETVSDIKKKMEFTYQRTSKNELEIYKLIEKIL